MNLLRLFKASSSSTSTEKQMTAPAAPIASAGSRANVTSTPMTMTMTASKPADFQSVHEFGMNLGGGEPSNNQASDVDDSAEMPAFSTRDFSSTSPRHAPARSMMSTVLGRHHVR